MSSRGRCGLVCKEIERVVLREVNQRFTRVESSIVALAESIAKLSTQLQMQRLIKDDVHQLRQEVAELRQQIQHQNERRPFSTSANVGAPSAMPSSSQQSTRFIPTHHSHHATTTHNTHPLGSSTSFMPPTTTTSMQRGSSILDPRQARKIER